MQAYTLPPSLFRPPSALSSFTSTPSPFHFHPTPQHHPSHASFHASLDRTPLHSSTHLPPPSFAQPHHVPPSLWRLLAETVIQLSVAAFAITASVIARTRFFAFATAFLCIPQVVLSVRRYLRESHRSKLDVSSVIFPHDSDKGGHGKEREEEEDNEVGQSEEGRQVEETKEEKGSLALAAATGLRAVVAEEVDTLRYALEQMERAAVQGEQVRNASIAQAIASLGGEVRALKRTVETRNQTEGAAPFALVSELEVTKEKLRQAEMHKAELELKLKMAQESFEGMKRRGEQARRDVDEALHKEMLLRHQVASLEGRVARLDELTERLERAERRNDELREMVVGEAREKEDLKYRAGDAEKKVVRVENVVNILKERLKTFAGPREEDMERDAGRTDEEKRQRFLERRLRQAQSFGAGSLLYEELLGKDREQSIDKEWPESPLDRSVGEKKRRAQLEGLPPDGGFGAPDDLADGLEEQGRIEEVSDDFRQLPGTGVDAVFSFSRGEFDGSSAPIENAIQEKTERDTSLPEPSERSKTVASTGGSSPSLEGGGSRIKPQDTNESTSNLDESILWASQGASAVSSADDKDKLSKSGFESTESRSERKGGRVDIGPNKLKSTMISGGTEFHRNDEEQVEVKSAEEYVSDEVRRERRKRAVIKVIRRRSSPAVNNSFQKSVHEEANSSQGSGPTGRNPEEESTFGASTAFVTPPQDDPQNDSQFSITDSAYLQSEPRVQGASESQQLTSASHAKDLNQTQSNNFSRDPASDLSGMTVPVLESGSSDAISELGATVTSASSSTTESELTSNTQKRVTQETSDGQSTVDSDIKESSVNAPEPDVAAQHGTPMSSQHPHTWNSEDTVDSSCHRSTEPRGVLSGEGSKEKQKSYLEKLEEQTNQFAQSSLAFEESNPQRSDVAASIDKPSSESLEHKTVQTDSQTAEKGQVGTVTELVDRANELVKKARQRGLTISQSEMLFKQAVSELECALELGDERAAVEVEIGATLLSWAKMNIVGTEAKDRLVRALGHLSSGLEKRPGDELILCNTGLCLCLLASTSDAKTAKGYYERACGLYDELLLMNAESRIGSFNCGLAYISLGRLELREDKVDAEKCREYFEIAAKRFERSLELKPGDGKAQSYLDDCERELAKLNEGTEK